MSNTLHRLLITLNVDVRVYHAHVLSSNLSVESFSKKREGSGHGAENPL